MTKESIDRELVDDDSGRRIRVRMEHDGRAASITWPNNANAPDEPAQSGPSMLLQPHGDYVLISVWDNEHQEPIFIARLNRAGNVINGEINGSLALMLDRGEN